MAQLPRELDPTTGARALFGYQLRQLRTARGLSLNDLGRFAHLSGAAIGTYEKGRSLPPDKRTVALLDDALAAHGILAAVWHYARLHTQEHADSHADIARLAPGADTITFAPRAEPDPVVAAAQRAAEFGAWAERTGLGPVSIEVLRQQVRALARDCLGAPPHEAAATAANLADRVYALIRETHRPALARELYSIASQVTGILAWLSGEVGQVDAAVLLARTAWACAELAEDPATSAWACVVASKTAFWRHDYAGALEFARRGTAIAAPGSVTVMLACQSADAHSMLGAAEPAQAALREARDAAERQRGADPVGGLLSCGPVRRLNYFSSTYLEIGEPQAALTQADAALELCAHETSAEAGFGTRAQIHITRTKAHVAAGRIDAAHAALRPVLDLPAPHRLATLTSRLAPLPATLTTSQKVRGREASMLAEEIVEFCKPPATAHTPAIAIPREELT